MYLKRAVLKNAVAYNAAQVRIENARRNSGREWDAARTIGARTNALAEVMNDPTATAGDRQRAYLAYA